MARKAKEPAQELPPVTTAINDKPPVSTVELSRCSSCGSTERGHYFGKVEQEYKGVDDEGQPYTHIVRRRTRCKNCGQVRIDRTVENRAAQED